MVNYDTQSKMLIPNSLKKCWGLPNVHKSLSGAMLGQGHQNLIKVLNHTSNTMYEVWSESIIWFKR